MDTSRRHRLLSVLMAMLLVTLGATAMAPVTAQAGPSINPLTNSQKLKKCEQVYLTKYSYAVDVSASAYSSMQAAAWNCDGSAPVLKSQAQLICETTFGVGWKLVPQFKGMLFWKKFTGWACSKG